MPVARQITDEEIMMLHMLGVLPRHIFGLSGHPLLDMALKPGKLHKTLRLLLPQYGFTPGYPETLLARAQHALTAQLDAGVVAVSCFEPEYPKRLLELDDFPPLIYCLGDCSLLSSGGGAAIVGAPERQDDHEVRVSWTLGKEFGGGGNSVWSELSGGCHAAVLRGCLEAGGRPRVVAAHGLDTPLAPDVETLKSEVLDCGGVILSEHPFGRKPSSRRLAARYRLLAALADELIIARMPAEQGELLSAIRFAQHLHRPIKAWRYDARNESNAGNFNLIGTGIASPIVLK